MKLSAVGLIILRDEALLVQRGARVRRYKGGMGLFGGAAVEPWKTEIEVLRRKIFEEIEVDVTVWGAIGRLLLKFREWYSGKRVQLSFREVAPVEN